MVVIGGKNGPGRPMWLAGAFPFLHHGAMQIIALCATALFLCAAVLVYRMAVLRTRLRLLRDAVESIAHNTTDWAIQQDAEEILRLMG